MPDEVMDVVAVAEGIRAVALERLPLGVRERASIDVSIRRGVVDRVHVSVVSFGRPTQGETLVPTAPDLP